VEGDKPTERLDVFLGPLRRPFARRH
jgi:hypothetical protein